VRAPQPAYIRHLFNVGEPSAGRLVTLHNLAWLSQLVRRAREAVLDGTFARLAGEVTEVWGPRVAPGRQAEQLG